MAKIKFPTPPPAGPFRYPRVHKQFLTRLVNGVPVVVKWPRSAPPLTDRQRCLRAQMELAGELNKYATPYENAVAQEWQIGSNNTWKDILTMASFATMFYITLPDGTELKPADHGCPETTAPDDDSMAWTIIHEWLHSVSGNTAQINITDLDGWSDILIVMVAVPTSSSAFRVVRASVDNGASYFSALGNYRAIAAAGSESDQNAFYFHTTSTTAALTHYMWLTPFNAANKYCRGAVAPGAAINYRFNASDTPINALRILPTAGNFSGGKFGVFAR